MKYNLEDYEAFTYNDSDAFLMKVITEKDKDFKVIVNGCDDKFIGIGVARVSYNDAFNAYTFADGSPFGKLKKKSKFDIAKEKYKKGMRVKSPYNEEVYIIEGEFEEHINGHINCLSCSLLFNDRWADILPILTTEDGVDVFDPNESVWYYSETLKNLVKTEIRHIKPETVKCFSTKDAYIEYIEKDQEKDLNYFESILLKSEGNSECFDGTDLGLMKDHLHWIYWQLVLKKILDYYSGDSESKYVIQFDEEEEVYETCYYYAVLESPRNLLGTEEACQKAIEIMGDKLDYIYKK